MRVLDPFAGCGTVLVCAKQLGIDSIGVEAHSFVSWVAKTKTYWEFNLGNLRPQLEDLVGKVESSAIEARSDESAPAKQPLLLHKMFTPSTLNELLSIASTINRDTSGHLRDLCTLALVTILRRAAKSGSSFPYVLPNKTHHNKIKPFDLFSKKLWLMFEDLAKVASESHALGRVNINGGKKIADARNLSFLDDISVDFAFTSPPYLNNVDYADATRLEMYFLGLASSWADLRRKVRSKLIISAAHQASELGIPESIQPSGRISGEVREGLLDAKKKLSEIKKTKGGKKDYDIMCISYFNDMSKSLEEVKRVLRPNAYYLLVLGDSAPYGVHIPTDLFLAKIARGMGFSSAEIEVLRERGGKWTQIIESGRRHGLALRESLVVLRK
jgi:DNA modification methylase